MRHLSSVILLLLLLSISAVAQNRTFKWTDELCEYQGTYNAKKYSLMQIRNTEKLLSRGIYSIQTSATIFDPSDLAQLDLLSLEREYAAKVEELKSLDIVKVPYWQQLRKKTLAEMKQVYELSRVTIPGHSDPRKLIELTWAGSCKTKYAQPLIAGGESLLNIWRVVNEDSRKKNSDPERLRRKFEQQFASKDRMKFALVEVMTFGWWNCANDQIKYVATEGRQEREFKKLFTRVKTIRCDQP